MFSFTRTPAVTAEEMRGLDRAATDVYAIPSLLLMENAGAAVAREVLQMLHSRRGRRRVLIVCGPGNNGGDGFCAARHLSNAGVKVVVAYYGERERARGDALTNLRICEQLQIPIEQAPGARRLAAVGRDCDAIVDAMLGTGVSGEPRDPFRAVIPVVNRLREGGIPVLAVDIPSGVNADTGAVYGVAVQADVTVTFALPKIGLLTHPGAEHAGRIIVADIGIPREAFSSVSTFVFDRDCAASMICSRRPGAHKGDFGHVAIVAGSLGMTGAAALAGLGALRVGAGLVTLAVPASHSDVLQSGLPEAMTAPIPENEERAFGKASLERVLEVIAARDSAVIGPGFGRGEDTVRFSLELISSLKKPAVVDADALYAVSRDPSVLRKCQSPLVVTPHPGEMARLSGTTVAEVQSNRLEVARCFAREYRVVVVLKGAGTVTASPDGTAFINTSGTPGMATGGSGDVLSGMIGAALAGALGPADPFHAAALCVYLHGRAGEIAAGHTGESALIASDIANAVGLAAQELTPAWEEKE